MGLRVVQVGPSATVQDFGRSWNRDRGVPIGGAFDRRAHALANALLANPADAATVELTLFGGTFEAEVPLGLALAGAPMAASIASPDGRVRPIPVPRSFAIRAGERLIVGGTPRGVRTYLGVVGGWQTPIVMGSRSSEVALRVGKDLPAIPSTTPTRWTGPTGDRSLFDEHGPGGEPIRVLDGPEAGLGPGAAFWESVTFRVGTTCDRMGIRLEGPDLDVRADPDRLSAPVAPGAIQVVGPRPIVLGVACGTMGGFAHVGQVLAIDLDRLGQARPGDPVRFRRVGLDEARRLDRLERRRRSEVFRRIALIASDRPARVD